ncbi:MAG: methyltransferase domain-containing protein [Leptospirales bacterium]
MSREKIRPRPNYDKIASCYDLLLLGSGGYLKKSQLKLLTYVPDVDKALLVGEGTGNFLKQLKKQKDISTIVYIDSSLQMCRIARKKNRIRKNRQKNYFICGDLDSIQNRVDFSLVTTHYFLDQFEETSLQTTMKKIAQKIHPGGYWLFTDFMPPETLFQKAVIYFLYLFFRKFSNIEAKRIPDYHKFFVMNGFVPIKEKKMKFGIQTTLYQKEKRTTL